MKSFSKNRERKNKSENREIGSRKWNQDKDAKKSGGEDFRNFAKRDFQRKDETENASVIFGVLPVTEAVRSGSRSIEKIYVAEGAQEKRLHDIFTLAKEKRILVQKVPRQNLSKFVEIGANHQGVVAFVASADYYDAEKLLEEITRQSETEEKSLLVILDGLEDPRNLGAILRTVDCVGADGVFIPERRAVGLTETVAKTSAGATEYVKTAKVTNISNLIEDLKERNIWTVGTSADAKMNYTDWDWTQNSALVLGNEGKGLHRLVAEKCDVLVKIPLLGKIESLNVSVAAGVVLYEARRQRNLKRKNKEESQIKEVQTEE